LHALTPIDVGIGWLNYADLCFLGITSIDIVSGLTEANRQETSIKKAFIKSSSRVATLTISSKINT
jgi:DeoR/GlpR family transcriptional regulator of sugar metabolism